jgi:hypothetical protein
MRARVEDVLLGQVHGEEGEIEKLAHPAEDLDAVFLPQGLGKAARHPGDGMNRLVGKLVQSHLGQLAHLDDPLGQVRVGLDDADHVAHGIVGVRPDDEIGGGQKEKVQQFVFGVGNGLHQLAQLAAGRRRSDAEAAVHRLVGRQVVHPWANAADAADDPRQLLGGLALHELLEPAHRQDVDPRLVHVARVVEFDADGGMPLDAGDGLDMDNPGHGLRLLSLTRRPQQAVGAGKTQH